MNVKEMIEYLRKMPQDAMVTLGCEHSSPLEFSHPVVSIHGDENGNRSYVVVDGSYSNVGDLPEFVDERYDDEDDAFDNDSLTFEDLYRDYGGDHG